MFYDNNNNFGFSVSTRLDSFCLDHDALVLAMVTHQFGENLCIEYDFTSFYAMYYIIIIRGVHLYM